MLYPLKFEPIYKERIWGGTKLRENYNRMCPEGATIGESWEISGLEEDVSVVSNGILAGNDLRELIEVYMGDLVGDMVYDTYGEEFPLMVKLLDAADILSVQVHPDDTLAAERHAAYGKSEMWYVMEAEKDSTISLGFKNKTSRTEFIERLGNSTVASMLKQEPARKGSIYNIPAGTIHALGKGVMVAEIQQSSDITYRIFDWNRTDKTGRARELNAELSFDALNFDAARGLNMTKDFEPNREVRVLDSPYFTTNIIEIDGRMERDYAMLDSFVIYVCVEGGIVVECEGGAESMVDAETILLPAMFNSATLSGKGRLLEVYMPKEV